jgi:hypothetical protein
MLIVDIDCLLLFYMNYLLWHNPCIHVDDYQSRQATALKQTPIHLAHATRTVIAITCMFFGLIGLLLPVLPGIPFLIIAVVLLATSGDTGSAQPLDGLRLAALRIARLCLISLDMLSKRLFGR